MIALISCDLLRACPDSADPHLPVQFSSVQAYPRESASSLGNVTADEDLGRRIGIELAVNRHVSRWHKTDGIGRRVIG